VRPFVVLAKLLKKFGFLLQHEFMYLFPLCIDEKSTEFIIAELDKNRTKEKTDFIITEIFMRQENYRRGLEFFLNEKNLSAETFCKIGFNRKSRNFDKPYFRFYNALKKVYFDGKKSSAEILELYDASDLQNVKTLWRKILFLTSSGSAIKKNPVDQLQRTNLFSNCRSEKEFKKNFYQTMHLIKIKRTLEDYFDLNRRYLKISDTLLFADNQVKFDVVPKYFFSMVHDDFYNLAFKKSSDLYDLKPIEEISPFLKIDISGLLKIINRENKTNFAEIGDIKKFVYDERTERFNKLIDEKFSDENLILILELFRNRNSPADDKEIQKLVTDEADGPTIFEYVLAIIWYKISSRKGDVLSFMNLSLEADLLPKTHAGGGEADIVWQYDSSAFYPRHNLLIEATLSSSTNQRRMEMEPVSRHLGEYILSHKNCETYCVFLTNFLHINLISDFRGRKNSVYYSSDENEQINGMMIIPLDTEVLSRILKSGKKYSELYAVFKKHYEMNLQPKEWYKELSKNLMN
jgi:hypothetical protein